MNIIWSDDSFAVVDTAIDAADAPRLRSLHEQLDGIRGYLIHEADRLGESRDGHKRLWFFGVFQIRYEVRDSGTIYILKARVDDRRWKMFHDSDEELT